MMAAPDAGAIPNLSVCAATRVVLREKIAEVMRKHDLDLFVFQADPHGAQLRTGGPDQELILVSTVNDGGLPTVSIPGGVYENGMPFSLAFWGPEWREAELLAYASDYENAFPHRIVP